MRDQLEAQVHGLVEVAYGLQDRSVSSRKRGERRKVLQVLLAELQCEAAGRLRCDPELAAVFSEVELALWSSS